jgi:hypothetical protein
MPWRSPSAQFTSRGDTNRGVLSLRSRSDTESQAGRRSPAHHHRQYAAPSHFNTVYTYGVSGWFATGFHPDHNEDHCVSLCGYGTIDWLAHELKVSVPAGVNGTQPGYAMFTWDTVGIIDVPSMVAITEEAWLRRPTTKVPRRCNARSGGGFREIAQTAGLRYIDSDPTEGRA